MTSGAERSVRATAALVIGLLVALLVPSAAGAVPGEVQTSFAGDGSLDLEYGAYAFRTDAAGRIVVATVPDGNGGRTLPLHRYTADGAHDPTFSGDGVVTFAFASNRLSDPMVWPQADGIKVALWTVDGLLVWKVGADGVLDPSFGTGGLAVVPIGPRSGFTRISVEPVGDGLVAVWNNAGAGHIVRLGPDGQPVAAFGGDGAIETARLGNAVAVRAGGGLVVSTALGLQAVAVDGTLGAPVDVEAGDEVTDLAVDAQDRVLVALTTPTPGSTTILRRLTSAFAVDPTYGTGGSVALVGTGATFHEVAGRRLVSTAAALPITSGNTYEGQIRLTALDADGVPDPSYGSGGTALVATRYSEGVHVNWAGRPGVRLAPAPAGGLAIGAEYAWDESSLLPSRYEHRLHQVSASGQLVATYPNSAGIIGSSVGDGGDEGATVLARAGSGSRLVRVELQQPDPPGAPGSPVVTAVDGATYQLSWTAASGEPTRYVVSAYRSGPMATEVAVEVPGSQLSASITVPQTGRPYRFGVYAVAGTSTGPRSASSPFTIAPFASMTEFVALLGADVPSWAPTADGRAIAAAHLGQYGGAQEWVGNVVGDRTFRSEIEPVARLYAAYFGRTPDSSGLWYWLGKRRAGVTVARISAQFAGSSEFRRTYGRLSDRAFVDLVYRNVLGRAPDPGGLDYWTARVASRRTSRGHLMASFSESDEHVRKLAWAVEGVRSYFVVLGRAPKASEVTWWTTEGLSADLKRATLLESAEYAARVG